VQTVPAWLREGTQRAPLRPSTRTSRTGTRRSPLQPPTAAPLPSVLSRELPHIHPAWRPSASSGDRADRQGPKITDATFGRPVQSPPNTGLVTNHPEISARSLARQDTLFRNAVPHLGFRTVTAPNQAMQRTLRAPRFACALVPLIAQSLGDTNPKTGRRGWPQSAQKSTRTRPTSRNNTPPTFNQTETAAPTHLPARVTVRDPLGVSFSSPGANPSGP
jgi:hypothetical protein